MREGVNEALKLEAALARLQADTRVAIMHYSPIPDTIHGEPLEVYPFLGSRRLEEPLNRYHVSVVFHGHAHGGSPEGRTAEGIPVYNVAKPLLERCFPGSPGYRIVEMPAPAPVAV